MNIDKFVKVWQNRDMMKTEREVAVIALRQIVEEKAYSNIALRRILADYGHFSRTQRAFVTEIVNGCIRNLFLIDHTIADSSSVPIRKMKPLILNILRISTYQFMFMDKVPTHAVVDEAVKIAKKHGLSGLAGFVNAVLRTISQGKNKIPTDLSIRYSVQPWIVHHLINEIGLEATKSLLENIMKPPIVTLCVNTLKVTVDELIEILSQEGVDATACKNGVRASKISDITALPSFQSGLYHVMDESAMMALKLASPPPNANIIDVCAAPGGKAFMAAYMAGQEASILATDLYPHKIKLLNDGAKRLGLTNVTTKIADARIFCPNLADTADLLIVDAPCSGLGTMRKRPDIKLFKQPESLEALALLTREIIEASWRYVKVGGRMLFCTCTISKVENIDNFNWIVSNLPFKPVCEPVQILPQDFDSDGFFIAVLERVE